MSRQALYFGYWTVYIAYMLTATSLHFIVNAYLNGRVPFSL